MDYYDLKPWDKFEPDSNRPGDILREVARNYKPPLREGNS